MIELLSRLSEGSLPPVDNDVGHSTSQACITCRGWRKLNKNRNDCPRCGGSGKMHDTSGQSQTRSKRTDSDWTAADIAGMCQGAEAHWYWAGMVYVCSCHESSVKLAAYLTKHVIPRQEKDWKLEPKNADRLRAGLACIATENLMIHPNRVFSRQACITLGVSKSSYSRTWRGRAEILTGLTHEYTNRLDRHMVKAHYNTINQLKTAS